MGKVSKLHLDDPDHAAAPRNLHLRDVDAVPHEAHSDVGAQLHSARIARGEDIDIIASRLRIRRGQLEAIETGDHQKLPGGAYSIGFVRAYAEYLGLDQAHIVAAFKAEMDAVAQPSAALHFPEAEDETRVPRGAIIVIVAVMLAALYGVWMWTVGADRVDEEQTAVAPATVPAQRVSPPIVASPVISETPAVLAPPLSAPESAPESGTASGTASGPESSAVSGQPPGLPAAVETPASAAPDTTPETTLETASAPPAAAGVEDVAPAAVNGAAVDGALTNGAAANGDVVPPLESGAARTWEGFVYGQQNHGSRVFIRATAPTWVRIEDADGQVLLSRTLRAGESYRAPNRAGLVLATRDAGALELYVDGRPAGSAGTRGQVVADMLLDPAALSGQ